MEDNRKKAVAFMLLSGLSFALMGAFVKLSGEIPVFEKVFFRNLISMLVAFALIRGKSGGGPVFGKRENLPHLLSRSLLGLCGVVCYFIAINNMNLADSAMLNKLSPFFVTLFAALFLKERLGKAQIPALIIVFLSSLLIIKPRFDLSILPALAGFCSAICAGGAYTLIRFLKNRERPETIVFFFSFASVIGTFPLMLMDFVMPTGIQFLFLLLIGVAASFGQFGLTLAYRYAPASEISIYNYTSILFAALVGFLIWGEVPDIYSIAGGIGIILVATALFFSKRVRESKAKT